MDTSTEYIRQCERATEIQPFLQPFHMMEQEGDLFYDYDDVWYAYLNNGVVVKVWLPRQDQLQEMVNIHTIADCDLVAITEPQCREPLIASDFCGGCWFNDIGLGLKGTDSMEQLWLAFVMLTLYHKKWGGGQEWLNILSAQTGNGR